MVGVNLDQASKLKLSKDLPDTVDPRPGDLSFVDSLLDFESIETWFGGLPNPDMDVVKSEPIDCEVGSVAQVTSGGGQIGDGSDPIGVKYEALEGLSCCIEEELGKVSLVGESGESLVLGSGNGVSEGLESKVEGVESKMESESGSSESSESESSSSSSSGSSDDEESEGEGVDEEKDGKWNVKVEANKECGEVAYELEEGEISGGEHNGHRSGKDGDEDEEGAEVAWSDVDIFDEGDEEEEAIKGPIRSKNELEVLPPVPPVNATLEPHHQMLPVGVVLSVVDRKVIVEGVEKHNPLNEGSILWITESRSPLGLVDEIFGPVINPYYMVRYNTESEIPAGIEVGTPISFVQEFADHVLNNKDLYRKGYDASGANDEEVSDEAEFSDDEKEAEYKRLQKVTKRGMNDQNGGNKKNNRKKGKNKMGSWQNDQSSPQQAPPEQQHEHFSSAAPARSYGPSSSAVSEGMVSGRGRGRGSVPPHPQAPVMNANGVWTNGMPLCQQQQTPFPNAFPNNNMSFFPQFPYQMSMPGGIPFHQQANVFSGLMGSPGMMGQQGFHQPAFGMGFQGQPIPGQQFNSFPGPMNAFGMGQQAQNGFNPNAFGLDQHGQNSFNPNPCGIGQQVQHGFNPNAFVMGQQGQHGFNQGIGGSQGQPTNPSLEQNVQQPGNPVTGNVDTPKQFGRGTSGNRGRRPYHRGRGQFAGGRGRGSK